MEKHIDCLFLRLLLSLLLLDEDDEELEEEKEERLDTKKEEEEELLLWLPALPRFLFLLPFFASAFLSSSSLWLLLKGAGVTLAS